MDLPPGFRFHPTDEELITHYLRPKVLDNSFSPRAVGEVDLNKCEPWDLPERAKMGDKEWYFFCVRDRKYPTGLRTNRATEAGYWKATGKDKAITRGKSLVGMKKILVFHRGRAPKGEKSDWVMHEYRLEGKSCPQNLPTLSKNEWVICRVFRKSRGGEKSPFPELLMTSEDCSFDFNPSGLPPLMDSSPYNSEQIQTKPMGQSSSHVSCFSNTVLNPGSTNRSYQTQILNNFDDTATAGNNNNSYLSQGYYFKNQAQSSHYASLVGPIRANSQYTFGDYMYDQEVLRATFENNGGGGAVEKMKQGTTTTTMKAVGDLGVTVSISQDTRLSSEMSSPVVSNYEMGQGGRFDDQEGPSTSSELFNVESFWN